MGKNQHIKAMRKIDKKKQREHKALIIGDLTLRGEAYNKEFARRFNYDENVSLVDKSGDEVKQIYTDRIAFWTEKKEALKSLDKNNVSETDFHDCIVIVKLLNDLHCTAQCAVQTKFDKL
jgi:hypothetical protein